MELREMSVSSDAAEYYLKSIKEIERKANAGICECCGCVHNVRLHVGSDMQVTPIYGNPRPCQEHMRDVMSEIRALQNRMGLPENIC